MENFGEIQLSVANNLEEILQQGNAMQDIEDALALVSSEFSSSSSDGSEVVQVNHPKYVDFLLTIDSFDHHDFKSHMGLQRQTMEFLILRYSQYKVDSAMCYARGKKQMDPRAELYMYTWYISNTITYRQLGNLFGVSKSSAWIAVHRITSWLIKISHEYIKWPEGAIADEIKAKFQQKEGIPDVIGAIDCTHIKIKAPKSDKESYFNRKQSYSLVLQAVVDVNKLFVNITCGEPGSLHDSRVLRRSDLFKRAERNSEHIFPNESFLLGDSAYAPSRWLIPPFKDYGNLTDHQRNFNKLHSGTRIVVENAFGLLKGRFRRLLKFTEQSNLSAITNLIMSACVLHNICIIKDDLYPTTSESSNCVPMDEHFEVQVSIPDTNRRQTLFNYLLSEHLI